jgi:hypothetical protein
MGEIVRHTCSKCGYEVELFHGSGMGGRMSLLSCADCKRLYSWMTFRLRETPSEVPLQCPAAWAHNVSEWRAGEACPRCGEPIVQEEEAGDWD